MKKFIRFALFCLILPVSAAAFYEESTLKLSANGHIFAQIVLMLGLYLLAWAWIRFDEINNLREYLASEHGKRTYWMVHFDEDQAPGTWPETLISETPRDVSAETAQMDTQALPEIPGNNELIWKDFTSDYQVTALARNNKN
jgi:hypothetical protein